MPLIRNDKSDWSMEVELLLYYDKTMTNEQPPDQPTNGQTVS